MKRVLVENKRVASVRVGIKKNRFPSGKSVRSKQSAAIKSNSTGEKGTSTSRKYTKESTFEKNPRFLDFIHCFRIRSDINLGKISRYVHPVLKLFFSDNRGGGIASVRRRLVENRENLTDRQTPQEMSYLVTKRSICDTII